MNKCEVEKLITGKSDRVKYERHNGKSEAWPYFLMIFIDETFCNFVQCIDCKAVLKYSSRDGTSSMKGHIDACKKKTGIGSQSIATLFTSTKKRVLTAPDRADFADCLAIMCAKDIRRVLVFGYFGICMHIRLYKLQIDLLIGNS